jgi:electron transfer flavoprotein alpha subunit
MSVLVFAENWEGKFKKQSYELVTYARQLADILGYPETVVSIGNVTDEELKSLGEYGADRIVKISGENLLFLDNQSYTTAIAEVATAEKAMVLVLANNNTGKAIAPRLSVRMKAGMAAGVNSLPSGRDTFVVRKKVFSGKAFASVRINSEKKIITLAQNSFEIRKSPRDPVILSFTPEQVPQVMATEIKDVHKQAGKIILTDAELVVSGGRGMRSPDNWGPLEELAGVMGAALACSRPVSDEGWRPHEEHTGQTGKIIAPNLYMAFGISGAIQHLAGVSSSKCMVAVNTDKNAPIFEAADYGVVGDAHKVIPDLIREIRALKNQ